MNVHTYIYTHYTYIYNKKIFTLVNFLNYYGNGELLQYNLQ